MVAWYKHDIPAWMDGTEDLEDGPYRIYHVVCQLIYLNEGPIALNERGIAGRCCQRIDRFRVHLKTLVDLGKLTLIEGKISNERCASELVEIKANRINAGKGGRAPRRKVSDSSPHTLDDLSTTSRPPLESSPTTLGNVSSNKTLKYNGADGAALQVTPSLREEKRREEKNGGNAASAAILNFGEPQPEPSSQEKQYFERARELLGAKYGGSLGAKLLKVKGGLSLARSALEQAATKTDPREYVGACIRGHDPSGVQRGMDPRL